MIKDFFILDFSYEVKGGLPIIYIWGIDRDGNRCVVIEKNFRPYFYALYDGDEKKIIENIKKLSRAESPITKVDIVQKKYFGNPVKALQIYTIIPTYIRIYREDVTKIKGVKEVLEADIRFYMRYSIDNDLKPFNWFEAEVEEIKADDVRVKHVYELKKIINRYEGEVPDLKIISFSIEVYNKYGYPNPRRDPIILIGLWSKEGGIQLSSENKDDLKILREFVNYIISYDPDIIVGFNSNGFDWSYILERAKTVGVKLDLSRKIGAEISQGTYGHYSIIGRLNVDLIGFIMSLEEVKSKTLINVADYLGVLPKEKRTIVEWYDIPRYWDDESKRNIVKQYNLDNAKSIYLLGEIFLPFGEELSKITGLPLDQLSMASVGNRVEWLLIREAYKANELIPNKTEKEFESYKGGLVIEPKAGIYEDVYVLDFSSMYPSIMIKFNIGPDTLVKGNCENCWISPEVGHKFRKEPSGFYKIILEKLIEERKKIKEKMESVKNEYELRKLENRQRALKVLANAFYGYMGWYNARWYSREGAEAVTAWGRSILKSSVEIAKSLGFDVIYGDTDSIFVKGLSHNINKLIDKISESQGLEVRVDKHYRRVLFTENKKRYAGLLDNGKIDIVGFEAVRGDWCELAKDIQKHIIEKILVSGNINEAVKLVRSTIMKLRRGEYNIEDLVIWKSLEKDIDEYEVSTPHVIAAKKAIQAGYPITKGSRIGYVVVKGSGRVSDRVEPYFLVKEKNRVDIEYYVNNQIIPSALRILQPFGVKENMLKTSGTDILGFLSPSKKK